MHDMQSLKMTGVAVLSATLAMLPAQHVEAQGDRDDAGVAFSVRAGPTMPAADLADATEDVGTALGAEVAFPLAERLSLSVDGNVDMLNSAVAAGPDLNLWHYGAGLDLEATPQEAPLSVVISGGANATTMDTGELDPTEDEGFNETYFGVNAGLEVGYDVTESVEVAVRGASFYVFADADETSALVEGIEGAAPFDRAITIPITAEVSIAMN